jgi:hypothetical protein
MSPRGISALPLRPLCLGGFLIERLGHRTDTEYGEKAQRKTSGNEISPTSS